MAFCFPHQNALLNLKNVFDAFAAADADIDPEEDCFIAVEAEADAVGVLQLPSLSLPMFGATVPQSENSAMSSADSASHRYSTLRYTTASSRKR